MAISHTDIGHMAIMDTILTDTGHTAIMDISLTDTGHTAIIDISLTDIGHMDIINTGLTEISVGVAIVTEVVMNPAMMAVRVGAEVMAVAEAVILVVVVGKDGEEVVAVAKADTVGVNYSISAEYEGN